MKRIRLGDKVRVISGKYKGVDGAVIAVNHKDNTVTVENVNLAKKHQKRSQKTSESKIVQVNLPIDVSNVAVLDEKNHNTPTKVKYTLNKQNKKIRVARKSGNEIIFKKK
ncbi:MAG: 50S ribosomal protein L24 [Mycoplasmataceae bacterium]|nr:50S ribosomal protein L24 [Mycoplasmataceae bacterium]